MTSGLGRWMISFAEKFPSVKSATQGTVVKAIMQKPVAEYSLRDLPLVRNEKVDKVLSQAFARKYGGISVIVAPPGSGKSTYLRHFANNFLESGGFVQYFASELNSSAQFYKTFGSDERSEDLFTLMPEKSVIVLDQVETWGTINDDMKRLLRHLALESRRTTNRNVIVSVSDMEVAKLVLCLNGNDKIRAIAGSEVFMWDSHMVDEFVRRAPNFKSLTEEQHKRLQKFAIHAASPGFLHLVSELHSAGDFPDDDRLQKHAETFRTNWKIFKENNL